MSTTRLRIWHPYRADVVGKGQRKAARMTLQAPLDIEVPTVPAGDVRVVGRVSAGRPDWAKTGPGEERVVTYRGWDDRLWTPVSRKTDRGTAVAVGLKSGGATPSAPFRLDAALSDYEHRTGTRVDWLFCKSPGEIEGRIVADDRVAAAEHAKDLAAKFIVVDDKIWQLQPEPMWAVQQMGLGCYCIYLDPPTSGRHPFRSSAETAFRADRLDDMREWCADIGRARHRDPETFGPSGRVIEFDPAFLRRDDLVLETCRLGEQVLRVFAERVAHMTVAGVDAYAGTRAAYERLVLGGSRADLPAFLDGVEAVVADMRRFDYRDEASASRDEALKSVDVLHLRLRNYEGAALAAAYGDAPPGIDVRAPTA